MLTLHTLSDFYDCKDNTFLDYGSEERLAEILKDKGYSLCKRIDSMIWDHGLRYEMPDVSAFYPKDIIFSDEIVTRTTKGGKSKEEIVSEINRMIKKLKQSSVRENEDAIKELEDIKNILKQLGKNDDEVGEVCEGSPWDRIFSKVYLEENQKDRSEDPYREDVGSDLGPTMVRRVCRDIQRMPYSYTVLGSYENGCITLYLNAICEYSQTNNLSVDNVFEMTFVHELFHLYHHCCTKLYGNPWEDSKEAQIVRESCAEYYSWLYVEERLGDTKLADAMWQSMQMHDYEVWPYAGAKYLKRYDHGRRMALKRVFKDSLCDWEDAYHDIVAYESSPRIRRDNVRLMYVD